MKKKEEIAAGRGRGTVQLTATDMDAAKLKPLNGKYSRHICETQRAAYGWANQLARATNWGYTTLVIKDGRKWAAIVPDRWINEAIKLNLNGYINELKAGNYD